MAENGGKKGDAVLVLALAAGKSQRDAAKEAGVGERTVSRRLQDRDFRRAIADTRAAIVGRAVGRLAELSTEAADTLAKLLKARSETVKLGAARAILEFGPKLRETEELDQRLNELETMLHELQKSN